MIRASAGLRTEKRSAWCLISAPRFNGIEKTIKPSPLFIQERLPGFFCCEHFKRLYDWERHMRTAHKSSPPITEGLDPSYLSPPSSSISQPTELQLRQRNVKSNLAVSDLGSSPRRAFLLADNRSNNCNNIHQPWQSGSDRPVPRLENKD